jgi:hypothetical protein
MVKVGPGRFFCPSGLAAAFALIMRALPHPFQRLCHVQHAAHQATPGVWTWPSSQVHADLRDHLKRDNTPMAHEALSRPDVAMASGWHSIKQALVRREKHKATVHSNICGTGADER